MRSRISCVPLRNNTRNGRGAKPNRFYARSWTGRSDAIRRGIGDRAEREGRAEAGEGLPGGAGGSVREHRSARGVALLVAGEGGARERVPAVDQDNGGATAAPGKMRAGKSSV